MKWLIVVLIILSIARIVSEREAFEFFAVMLLMDIYEKRRK